MNPAELEQARRQLVQALSVITFPAMDVATLEARNVTYHAEELLRALDAFYRSTASSQDQ
jgi:hypothetical protein